MTEAEVIQLIIDIIVANGNNQITANVLRPVLLAMLEQSNDKMGELSDLDTTDKTNLVNAINEALANGGVGSTFTVHSGTDNPNTTPPASYSIGDWYIRNGTSIYQYNGDTWVLLSNSSVTVFSEAFTYTSPNNTFTVINPINQIIDVQIEHGSNYNEYATIANGNEVTIATSGILYGGEKIRIIYK